jgi:hypothetical protein
MRVYVLNAGCGARDWQVLVPNKKDCVKPLVHFRCLQSAVRHGGIHIEVCNRLCGPLQGDPHGGAAGRRAVEALKTALFRADHGDLAQLSSRIARFLTQPL